MASENGLQTRLAALSAAGAEHFDPIGFTYIVKMANQSRKQQDAVRRRLEQKALAALDDLQMRFDAARAKAENRVARICAEHPAAAEKIKNLFEKADFRGVKRLDQRLGRAARRPDLGSLSRQIGPGGPEGDENRAQPSLDDLLQRQTRETIEACGHAPLVEAPPQARPELKSFNLLKETWAQLYCDRLVNQTLQELPEAPGPLNTQMLATRSLAVMREVSPAYLNRFVSYVHTLLWLESAGEVLKSGGRSK